jgi:cystathionine beta-lyase
MAIKYDFDRIIPREGTDCVKYDLSRITFGTDQLLPMWVADMDFEVPGFIREAVIRRAGHPVYGYTFRPARFFETAASWLYRRHGWEVSPGSFSFSPGIVPALSMIVMEFTSPGEMIVVQPPVYFPFFSVVKNHGRMLVYNRLLERDGAYSIDFDHLESLFRDGAKMMLFCHPHNPVGRVWKREELERLAELSLKYGVLVISDEVHSDLLLFGNRHTPLASLGKEVADLTITCIAPSKTFNLAGLYTSAVIATQPEVKKRYDRILDAVHVGGGCLFGQVAFEAAYSQGDSWLDQLITYLEANYRLLRDFLETRNPQMVISPLEATYLAWLDLSFLGKNDRELKEFVIREAGLGLNDGPMFGPGGEQHQRLNIGTPASILREGLQKLTDAVERCM